ncbi:hypothetical protein ACIHFE_20010 [Streptomyces sp. NPDC052396]|uniref:hypothetical protein n=1 Tax=Streptomyces sp. NPDC052396 TaxID=3365689 RepID=UPI0037D8FBD9
MACAPGGRYNHGGRNTPLDNRGTAITDNHPSPPPPRPRRPGRARLPLLLALTALLSAVGTVLALWAAGAFDRARVLGPQRLVVTSRNWAHRTPDADRTTHQGEVGPGPRWFSCWTHGEPLTALGHAGDIWVRTTNDQGGGDVYISADYLARNDPGDLPPCT